MEINIKKPKRKAFRKGISTKTTAAIQTNASDQPQNHEIDFQNANS